MDPQQPDGVPGEQAVRRPAPSGPSPYRLPGPLSSRGNLPVAPSAPRIPRALRAFNGMEEETLSPPAAPGAAPPPAAGALTIRDLLEESPSEEPVEDGPLAGLRSALRRLRRGRE